MTATSGQGEQHWKNKYYDQLDRLEKKEKDWADLESVLKRTVGRLTLAAEGQDDVIDRHIKEIRAVIKNDIDRIRLEAILDDLSKLLAKMEQTQSAPDKIIVHSLISLIEPLELPESCRKEQRKLLKRLNGATDKNKDTFIKEILDVLNKSFASQKPGVEKKSSFLDRIISGSEKPSKTVDISATASIISHVMQLIPWPDELKSRVSVLVDSTKEISTDKALSTRINQLDKIINDWKANYQNKLVEPEDRGFDKVSDSVDKNLINKDGENIDAYRTFVLEFIDRFKGASYSDEKITEFLKAARKASEKSELDKLSINLANLLLQVDVKGASPKTPDAVSVSLESQPNIQELLIRLLEQLAVPSDFHKRVEEMKMRLEQNTHASDWKVLLKDVAALINSIRIRMQQEKNEFESFLHQVTSRLKEMDNFLQRESLSVVDAEEKGELFDDEVNDHVNDIRNDMRQADNLESLKHVVDNRLENISKHIKDYRDAEKTRYSSIKKDVFEMQNQMMSLEKESENLKNIIVEKNKQAMFDVLTGIPNRLAYEQKSAEEIARWKRFSNSLSLAVWDIDFFKKVNDTYGHKAGDKVLKTIAQLLNDRIRETDFLARFGGEEFVMLLPGTDEEEALSLVNDLRKKVESCGFHYKGDAVPITVSCGVSSFRGTDTLEKVFERADSALYKAKDNGRNQCVVAS